MILTGPFQLNIFYDTMILIRELGSSTMLILYVSSADFSIMA